MLGSRVLCWWSNVEYLDPTPRLVQLLIEQNSVMRCALCASTCTVHRDPKDVGDRASAPFVARTGCLNTDRSWHTGNLTAFHFFLRSSDAFTRTQKPWECKQAFVSCANIHTAYSTILRLIWFIFEYWNPMQRSKADWKISNASTSFLQLRCTSLPACTTVLQ